MSDSQLNQELRILSEKVKGLIDSSGIQRPNNDNDSVQLPVPGAFIKSRTGDKVYQVRINILKSGETLSLDEHGKHLIFFSDGGVSAQKNNRPIPKQEVAIYSALVHEFYEAMRGVEKSLDDAGTQMDWHSAVSEKDQVVPPSETPMPSQYEESVVHSQDQSPGYPDIDQLKGGLLATEDYFQVLNEYWKSQINASNTQHDQIDVMFKASAQTAQQARAVAELTDQTRSLAQTVSAASQGTPVEKDCKDEIEKLRKQVAQLFKDKESLTDQLQKIEKRDIIGKAQGTFNDIIAGFKSLFNSICDIFKRFAQFVQQRIQPVLDRMQPHFDKGVDKVNQGLNRGIDKVELKVDRAREVIDKSLDRFDEAVFKGAIKGLEGVAAGARGVQEAVSRVISGANTLKARLAESAVPPRSPASKNAATRGSDIEDDIQSNSSSGSRPGKR